LHSKANINFGLNGSFIENQNTLVLHLILIWSIMFLKVMF